MKCIVCGNDSYGPTCTPRCAAVVEIGDPALIAERAAEVARLRTELARHDAWNAAHSWEAWRAEHPRTAEQEAALHALIVSQMDEDEPITPYYH